MDAHFAKQCLMQTIRFVSRCPTLLFVGLSNSLAVLLNYPKRQGCHGQAHRDLCVNAMRVTKANPAKCPFQQCCQGAPVLQP
ncbi:MAG: hypothetical protein M2R45_05164 [Verrucomicrobia subdivision 3 bacterium]|nr:hypothetical protein [Limisphaerales bacterium]MCS1413807.1 hypothetical protein [Limisphaerales bacterium]